jgi:hypothetical protein
MVKDWNDPKSSDESTAPTSSELTTPYDTGELRQVNQFQVKQLLEQLGAAPLRLRSDNLVPRPWGGRRLLEYKGLSGATRPGRYGESLEVSAYPLDIEAARYPSIVEFADGSSMRLSELIGRAGAALLGPSFLQAYGACIPLLPKFLDIEGLLSIQSHPAGLPEAYVIIDCAPGATIRVGFAQEIDPGQTVARLQAASKVHAGLHELFWTDESGYAPAFAELLGKPDAVRRLVERLTPMLRDQADRPRLLGAVTTLDACQHEMLELLNVITVEPGMVIFNSDATDSSSSSGMAGSEPTRMPSAQMHCLGNPEGRPLLLLEVRRPGVTYRAWDHVRFPIRELAIEETFAAVNVVPTQPSSFVVTPRPLPGRPGVVRSVESPAFIVDHLRPTPGSAEWATTEGAPTTLHGIRGTARLFGPDEVAWGLLRAGESLLLPAGVKSLRIEAQTPDAELVQVLIPLPLREVLEEPAWPETATRIDASPANAKRQNLARLRGLIAESLGPTEVLAIVNGGDAGELGVRLRALVPALFRADGETQIYTHEEPLRRGQLLGLLDALRGYRSAHGRMDPDRVALGIMLPGKGTRLGPATARLHGIKPLFPMPIRAAGSVWLDGAAASLWCWTLVCWTLERQGFRGVAWKWGDEAQIAGRQLSSVDYDLADVDAIRFGAAAELGEDLAENKEWLLVDPDSGELHVQLRRRPLAQLRQCIQEHEHGERKLQHLVHIGSPAFSHLFLRHAEQVFADFEGWIDVDGYLFEALTHEPDDWAAEVERDVGLREVLEQCPYFYERVTELRRRIEADRGHSLRIVVLDFGADPYWGDIGQLGKAREVWAALAQPGEAGEFARLLAALDGVQPDEHGNLLVGASAVPSDGSVRNCVVIDSLIDRGRAEAAVIVRSSLGIAGFESGAVAIDCHVDALRLGRNSFAFGSIGNYLRVPEAFAHTSIIDDPRSTAPRLESWFADMRVDLGASKFHEQPRWGNPMSFAKKFAQMRQRGVESATIDARVAKLAQRHGAKSLV